MNYARALQRIRTVSIVIGAGGVIGALIWRGPRTAVGFLIGAFISLINLGWWISLANALGPAEGTPIRGSTALLALRYIAVAMVIYVIVKSLEIKLAPVLVGLFVTVAAVIVEILYELISSE